MDTFVNDVIKLIIDTNIDISGYASLTIEYRKPDGTVGCWPATVCVDDNNCVTYTTFIGDLDVPGEWIIQAVAKDTGVALHGRWTTFDVHKPITATCPPLTIPVPTTTLAPTTSI